MLMRDAENSSIGDIRHSSFEIRSFVICCAENLKYTPNTYRVIVIKNDLDRIKMNLK